MVRTHRVLVVLSLLLMLFGLNAGNGQQNLAAVIEQEKVGATMCKYLAWKMQIHHRTDCGAPVCHFKDWNAWLDEQVPLLNNTAYEKKQRVIVSYSHNGFGNQLWQHTAAFMVAESLGARLYIDMIPEHLRPDGQVPPNSWAGFDTTKRLLPPKYIFENLPPDSYERQLCEQEEFVVFDRPRDWRNKDYGASFKSKLVALLTDPKPRCIKFLGYFQNMPLCYQDAKALWNPPLLANFTQGPGPNDVAVYLRCVPRHYFFNNVEWYEAILDRLTFDRLWLFQAPECPRQLSKNPQEDGPVAQVIRYLREKHNATAWPEPEGKDLDNETYLLHDLAGLARAKRMILPVSSWAYWGGVLSNATEIHVNAPPNHPLMEYNGDLYVYHDQKARQYFGKFNLTEYDLVYKVDLNLFTPSPTPAPTLPPSEPLPPPPAYNVTAALKVMQTELDYAPQAFDILGYLERMKVAMAMSPAV